MGLIWKAVRSFCVPSDWGFGSMEVNALFVSETTIKPAARAFPGLVVMDMIALPEWSSDYVAEPTP